MQKRIITFRDCPVCGCHVAKALFPVNLDLCNTALPDQYYVVSCDYCGMCYANTTASMQDYEQYYCECNYYGGHPGTVKQEEQNRFSAIEEKLRKYVAKNAKILDIGFGKGELLQYLQHQGYTNLQGMDPSRQSVSALQEKGIQGVLLSLQEEEMPVEYQKRYDVIILTEVWEHLYELKRCIQNVKALMKETGYLILTLPTFDDLSCYHLPLVNMINHEHINYFSSNSLDFFMQLNSMKSVELSKVIVEEEGRSITYGVLGVFQQNSIAKIHVQKDEMTRISLSRYFAKEQDELERKNQILLSYRNDGTPVIIWGAGTYLRQLWRETILSQCNITAVIDGSTQKQGLAFDRFIVEAPDKLAGFSGVVLIAVMRYGKEVRSRLKELGFQGQIIEL